jgi:hypothetical protein
MANKVQGQSLEGLRQEYSELNQNFRHYSALRFAILTVFFAVTGGLASVAFGFAQNVPPTISFAAKIGGFLISIMFFMFEIILQSYLHHFGNTFRKLEKSLGYSHMSTRPHSRIIRTQNATYGFFICVIAFWTYALFFM